MLMARPTTSQQWLDEHVNDDFVKRAKRDGYRSRAAYKLLEINQKDRILRPGMTVIDLGAAPGGWSQVAAQHVGRKGEVLALDRLNMSPIPGVTFIEGDFTEEPVLNQLLTHLDGKSIAVILSDMAPNTSGLPSVDQPRAIYLAELALDLAEQVLMPGGSLLIKVFQGAGFDELLQHLRKKCKKVVIRKPKASRSRSKETYMLATGYN